VFASFDSDERAEIEFFAHGFIVNHQAG